MKTDQPRNQIHVARTKGAARGAPRGQRGRTAATIVCSADSTEVVSTLMFLNMDVLCPHVNPMLYVNWIRRPYVYTIRVGLGYARSVDTLPLFHAAQVRLSPSSPADHRRGEFGSYDTCGCPWSMRCTNCRTVVGLCSRLLPILAARPGRAGGRAPRGQLVYLVPHGPTWHRSDNSLSP